MTELAEEHVLTTVHGDLETMCWGCGLRLILPSNAPVFKCGWCGAITYQDVQKPERKHSRWGRVRDRCFIGILFLFMLFIICGGVWTVYPLLFSISHTCGVFHSIITVILSLSTLSTFRLAAFGSAGTPPNTIWGNFPEVARGDLENYTFCNYCSKPKSPRTHHCRTCGMCILDMDHHCPFIGNCVGSANHRHFIFFLISATVSTIYVSIMSAYTISHIWPPVRFHVRAKFIDYHMGFSTLKELVLAFLGSAVLLSARGFILVYLFLSGVSVGLGLSALLFQQLSYIYAGKTYLSHLSSPGDNGERDCQNIVHFFGFTYPLSRFLPNFLKSRKRHTK